MARHALADPRVQAAGQQVADLVLASGTVQRALTRLHDALAELGESGQLYPNRIYALLDSDPNRSVNTTTLELVERALTAVTPPSHPSGLIDQIRRAAAQHGTPVRPDTVAAVARTLRVPVTVIERALAGHVTLAPPPLVTRRHGEPDWSYQDDAVRRALAELRRDPARRTALVIPTAGGKTRIAMRVALQTLAEHADPHAVVVWVTHRRNLLRQARRELQRSLTDPTAGWPPNALEWINTRVVLTMTRPLGAVLAAHRAHLALIVVDEAHHVAAPSYEAVFLEPVPALFLTATPNRADGQSLGVDSVAYTVSYRELFERGTVIEPVFDPAPFPTFQWTPRHSTHVREVLDAADDDGSDDAPVRVLDDVTHDDVHNLADYLLERTCTDLAKVLVVVSRVEYAERMYDALLEVLSQHGPDHPLKDSDIMMVHAAGSSIGSAADDALEAFRGQTMGILVATGQLVGEGFDDPGIDGVVITYPSSSMSHLMQVAGRALRYAPHKTRAHIIQVHQSPLEYHFEQRWLYQDITDYLRPRLIDRTVTSAAEAAAEMTTILDAHRVAPTMRQQVMDALTESSGQSQFTVMLSGLPYYGDPNTFGDVAAWNAIGIAPSLHSGFLDLFNRFSYMAQDARPGDERAMITQCCSGVPLDAGTDRALISLGAAMVEAAKERHGRPSLGQRSRPPVGAQGTTWLTYVTLTFAQTVPENLVAFLEDARNAPAIVAQYVASPAQWVAAVKVPLPIDGSWAYLLTGDQRTWLAHARQVLASRLNAAPVDTHLQVVSAWRSGLLAVPVAQTVVDRPDAWLSDARRHYGWLDLTDEMHPE